MKILSLHTRLSRDLRYRMLKMKAIFERERPDIICLQGFFFPMRRYIPKGYRRIPFLPFHPIYIKDTFGYTSRKWGWSHSRVIVHAEADQFQIININNWRDNLKTTMKTIEDYEYEHLGPTVACGDFGDELETIRMYAKGHIIRNAREVLGMKKEDTYKHHSKTLHGEKDHFFVYYANPKEYKVIPTTVSDHKIISCVI